MNRAQKIEFTILGVISLLLILNLLFRSDERLRYDAPAYDPIEKDSFRTVSIDNETGSVHYRMENGEWVIGEEGYPANPSHINALLDFLSQPVLLDMVARGNEETLQRYRLDQSSRARVTGTAESGEERTFYIGKGSASGRYSYVNDTADSRIFSTNADLSLFADAGSDDLRSKEVMRFTADAIDKITINGGELVLTLNNGVWQSGDGTVWLQSKADDLIRRMSRMQCSSFVDDMPGSGEFLTIDLSGNDGNYRLRISLERRGDEYSAESSEYGFPFALTAYTVDKIQEDLVHVEGETEEEALDDMTLNIGDIITF